MAKVLTTLDVTGTCFSLDLLNGGYLFFSFLQKQISKSEIGVLASINVQAAAYQFGEWR